MQYYIALNVVALCMELMKIVHSSLYVLACDCIMRQLQLKVPFTVSQPYRSVQGVLDKDEWRHVDIQTSTDNS